MTKPYIALSAEQVMTWRRPLQQFQIFIEINTLKATQSHLKGHMINRILQLGLIHIKFIKLAKGSFNKFHMK